MDATARNGLEDRRQIEHLAPIGFALLLPYLPYAWILVLSVAAIVHALYISPRLIRVTTRSEEAQKGFSPGKLYYALCVLALLLIFHDRIYIAAAVWGVLAVGDSLSNLLGRRIRSPRLFYNPGKTLAGMATFCLTGGLTAWGLLLWNRTPELTEGAGVLLAISLVVALLCALGESLPPVIDDNLVIVWLGGAGFFLLLPAPAGGLTVAAPLWEAVLANLGVAVLARALRWISRRGTALAALFGLLIYWALGPAGYSVILLFLVLSSLSTRLGWAAKQRLQVAEGEGGQRGSASVLAKGLVPFFCALLTLATGRPLLAVAYTAAVATATLDTVSTEIGQWLGRRPVDPLRLRFVPVGTQGAVSLPGTAAGVAGAAAVCAVAAGWGWITPAAAAAAGAGALLGGVFESVLGALYRFEFDHAHETLNLLATLFGATAGAVLWIGLAG